MSEFYFMYVRFENEPNNVLDPQNADRQNVNSKNVYHQKGKTDSLNRNRWSQRARKNKA